MTGALGIVAIVPLVAVSVVWTLAGGKPRIDLWMVAAMALACAVVIGVPVVHWAIERGRSRVAELAFIGAFAGALAPLFALVSGVIGFLAKGGLDYAIWVLRRGASLPWFGIMRWSQFYLLVLECAAIGAISAAIVTPLLRARRKLMAPSN